MSSQPEMESDMAADGSAGLRHTIQFQTLFSIERPDRVRIPQGQERAFGIRIQVFDSTVGIDMARSDQRDRRRDCRTGARDTGYFRA